MRGEVRKGEEGAEAMVEVGLRVEEGPTVEVGLRVEVKLRVVVKLRVEVEMVLRVEAKVRMKVEGEEWRLRERLVGITPIRPYTRNLTILTESKLRNPEFSVRSPKRT